MELSDLKKTWDKMSPGKELDETQLRTMLSKRTTSLIERIERNIKIGFGILFVLVLIIALDDLLISPQMLEEFNENYQAPQWLTFISIFSYTLIFTTFIFFVIKYYRVKKVCDVACNLKDTLRKIIETLNLYQRLFYLALVSLTVSFGLGFIVGVYQASYAKLESQGIPFSEIEVDEFLLQIVIGLVFLIIVVGGIFVFLRWGFRRLYGNYYLKLKSTLKELEDIED